MKSNKLVAPTTESEIIKHWKYDDRVYVSCVCITFNQVAYIRDAIESFLAQVSEYRFEILIHDDLSSDGTRDVLVEYQKKYPSIIRLILQNENQYSKGKKILRLAAREAKGEFIALCEGDDYWISQDKIQEQYELMQNSNYSFVAHNAIVIDESTSKEFKFNKNKTNFKFDTSYLLLKEWFIPTASIFVRSKLIQDELPAWSSKVKSGDYLNQILFSLHGGGYYSESTYSVYRKNSVGSLSSKQKNNWGHLVNRIYLYSRLLPLLKIRHKSVAVISIFKSMMKVIYSILRSR